MYKLCLQIFFHILFHYLNWIAQPLVFKFHYDWTGILSFIGSTGVPQTSAILTIEHTTVYIIGHDTFISF